MGAQQSTPGENQLLSSEEIFQFKALLNTIDGHDGHSPCTTKDFEVSNLSLFTLLAGTETNYYFRCDFYRNIVNKHWIMSFLQKLLKNSV